jgi:hypothetical protein
MATTDPQPRSADTLSAPRPTPTPAGRRRRRWPLVLGCLLALLAIPAGAYLYLSWTTGSDLQAAIDETDRLDPRWRFADLLADRKPIPDADNPAVVVMKVDALLRPGGFDLGQKNDRLFEVAAPVNRLNGPQVAALREALAKRDEAVKLARTLKEFPGEGRFPIKHSPDWISSNIESLQRCRDVMAMLQYDAMLRAEDGDLAGAMESCRALLCAARAIGTEPYLIAMLIRVAGEALTVSTLERILAQGVPPAEELRALQELLAREIERPLLIEGLRGERGGAQQLLDTLEKGNVKLSALTGGQSNSWEDWLFGMFPGVWQFGQADQLRLMNENIEAAKLPLEQQAAAFKQVEDKVKVSRSIAVRLLMPAAQKVAQAERRIQAQMRSALVGVAAERYRLEHGRWPESIEALVQAGLLGAVPLDPFDGQPLRFKRLADGLVIYSVGFDGVDNGGVLNRDNPTEEGTDLGFQLWDPDARRQIALPPPLDEQGPP